MAGKMNTQAQTVLIEQFVIKLIQSICFTISKKIIFEAKRRIELVLIFLSFTLTSPVLFMSLSLSFSYHHNSSHSLLVEICV